MKGIASTLAIIWRLATPYFYSEDRRAGRLLLSAVIATELSLVAINVLLNQWNNRFYNALQDHNWDAFVYELGYFCVLAAIFIVLAVYQLYLNQWLQIRWRRFMTERYLRGWLDAGNHYRMQLLGDAADNPDQRIAEDIQRYVEQTLTIGIGLLSSVVTLGSFVVILWGLSETAPTWRRATAIWRRGCRRASTRCGSPTSWGTQPCTSPRRPVRRWPACTGATRRRVPTCARRATPECGCGSTSSPPCR